MNFVDVLNIVDRGEVTQNKMLEKLMYLAWYNYKFQSNDPILNNQSYNLLAEKYYKEFDKTVATWDIPNRNIGDL